MNNVTATRRGGKLPLVYRSGDKFLQHVARYVAATNHDKSLTPQQNLSPQHVAQV